MAVSHDRFFHAGVDLLLRPIGGTDKPIEPREREEQTHQANPTGAGLRGTARMPRLCVDSKSLTHLDGTSDGSKRVTKAACSGVARPRWTIAITGVMSPRTSAAGSSHSPAKTWLRRHPSVSGYKHSYCPSRSTNQPTSWSSTRQTTYSRTPLRR